MDLRKLKTLIDLVAESSISELEITEGEGKVRIVKTPPPMTMTPVQMVSHAAAPVMSSASAPAGLTPVTGVEPPPAPMVGHRVTSPMVGTFYRASAPGASPFASVGDTVTEGQTLCVIEAMKLMNEIPADKAGVIKEVLVENGQAVEFGQALFVIA